MFENFFLPVQTPPTATFGLQRRRHVRIDPKRPQSIIEIEHQQLRHWKPVREGLRRPGLGRKHGRGRGWRGGGARCAGGKSGGRWWFLGHCEREKRMSGGERKEQEQENELGVIRSLLLVERRGVIIIDA